MTMATVASSITGAMATLKLKRLLKERHRSLYWLEQETGIAYTTLHRYFHDQTTGIRFEHIEKICKALDCDPNTLFGVKAKK